MATATKRRAKRGKAQAEKAANDKTAKRVKSGVSLETIKRDRDLASINAAYETRESSASSQVQWVSDVLRLFASDKKNFAIDDAIVQHLVKVESDIRMAARKRRGDPMPTANKRYVGKSQFVGVLRMAKMAGGVAMWKLCADVGNNWALAQELASKCRAYHKAHDAKWPARSFVEAKLTARKAAKAKSARGGGGGIKLGAPALINRIASDVKDVKRRFHKLAVELGMEVQLRALMNASERFAKAMKEHAAKAARAEKAKAA